MNTNFSLFFAGVAVVLLIIIGVQYWHNNNLESELSARDAAISDLQLANNQFKTDVADRNRAVDKLSQEAQKEHIRAQEAMNQAQALLKQANDMQNALDSLKSQGDECKRTYDAIDAGRMKIK